ncbi:MAG TPA: DUF4350 domain-containing protein [Steroidobacteraceae bacterium]|jgi:hypothetical protein
MKERLLVLGLAAGALALFYILFFPKPQPPNLGLDNGVPLTTDSRPDGYQAVWRWLGKERIERVSLRLPYDRLAGLLDRPEGNVMLVTMPQRVAARATELEALDRWVAQGNTLLIVAALDDAPPWAIGTPDSLVRERIQRLTGLHFAAPPGSTSDLQGFSVGKLEIRPNGKFPLLDGIRQLESAQYLSRSWHARVVDARLPLQLAARSDDGAQVIWLERSGAGQILLCTVASLFSNAGVLRADNALLLANAIAWSRGPAGAVIFDDAHQGLTEFYDAKAFFADPRLHATLGWIVLLWLAFVLGSQPLRIRRREWQPLDETAYVEAGGRYLAAVVRPADAAQRLIEEFLASLSARLSLEAHAAGDSVQTVWQWLRTQPAASAAERHELQTCYARACAGERVNLTRLQNLLAQLRRNLA